MNYEFKGTPGPWIYKPPTEKFDASTISTDGKVIGYCAKNSKDDRYNELLRSRAPEMFEMLQKVSEGINIMAFDQLELLNDDIEQLLKEATEV